MKSKSKYNQNINSDLLTMKEGAELCKIGESRFRKTIQRLKTPVVRHGWAVLISRENVRAVKKAIKDGVIKRGRPSSTKKEDRATSAIL
jgi:hypothetical protein